MSHPLDDLQLLNLPPGLEPTIPIDLEKLILGPSTGDYSKQWIALEKMFGDRENLPDFHPLSPKSGRERQTKTEKEKGLDRESSKGEVPSSNLGSGAAVRVQNNCSEGDVLVSECQNDSSCTKNKGDDVRGENLKEDVNNGRKQRDPVLKPSGSDSSKSVKQKTQLRSSKELNSTLNLSISTSSSEFSPSESNAHDFKYGNYQEAQSINRTEELNAADIDLNIAQNISSYAEHVDPSKKRSESSHQSDVQPNSNLTWTKLVSSSIPQALNQVSKWLASNGASRFSKPRLGSRADSSSSTGTQYSNSSSHSLEDEVLLRNTDPGTLGQGAEPEGDGLSLPSLQSNMAKLSAVEGLTTDILSRFFSLHRDFDDVFRMFGDKCRDKEDTSLLHMSSLHHSLPTLRVLRLITVEIIFTVPSSGQDFRLLETHLYQQDRRSFASTPSQLTLRIPTSERPLEAVARTLATVVLPGFLKALRLKGFSPPLREMVSAILQATGLFQYNGDYSLFLDRFDQFGGERFRPAVETLVLSYDCVCDLSNVIRALLRPVSAPSSALLERVRQQEPQVCLSLNWYTNLPRVSWSGGDGLSEERQGALWHLMNFKWASMSGAGVAHTPTSRMRRFGSISGRSKGDLHKRKAPTLPSLLRSLFAGLQQVGVEVSRSNAVQAVPQGSELSRTPDEAMQRPQHHGEEGRQRTQHHGEEGRQRTQRARGSVHSYSMNDMEARKAKLGEVTHECHCNLLVKRISQTLHEYACLWCMRTDQLCKTILRAADQVEPGPDIQRAVDMLNMLQANPPGAPTATSPCLSQGYCISATNLMSVWDPTISARLVEAVHDLLTARVKDMVKTALPPQELDVVIKLFPEASWLHIEDLNGGFSPSKVLLAAAVNWEGTMEPTNVVKIDKGTALEMERYKMELIRGCLGDYVPALLAFEANTSVAALRMELCGTGWTHTSSTLQVASEQLPRNEQSSHVSRLLCTFKDVYLAEVDVHRQVKHSHSLRPTYGNVGSILNTVFGEILNNNYLVDSERARGTAFDYLQYLTIGDNSVSPGVPPAEPVDSEEELRNGQAGLNLFLAYDLDNLLLKEIKICPAKKLATTVGVSSLSETEAGFVTVHQTHSSSPKDKHTIDPQVPPTLPVESKKPTKSHSSKAFGSLFSRSRGTSDSKLNIQNSQDEASSKQPVETGGGTIAPSYAGDEPLANAPTSAQLHRRRTSLSQRRDFKVKQLYLGSISMPGDNPPDSSVTEKQSEATKRSCGVAISQLFPVVPGAYHHYVELTGDKSSVRVTNPRRHSVSVESPTLELGGLKSGSGTKDDLHLRARKSKDHEEVFGPNVDEFFRYFEAVMECLGGPRYRRVKDSATFSTTGTSAPLNSPRSGAIGFSSLMRKSFTGSRSRGRQTRSSFAKVLRKAFTRLAKPRPGGAQVILEDCDSQAQNGPARTAEQLRRSHRAERPRLFPVTARYPTRVVHGDLNGRNIVVDSEESVWLIDWPTLKWHHALCDLAKLEASCLLEYTSLEGGSGDYDQAINIAIALAQQKELVSNKELLPSGDRIGVTGKFAFAWDAVCAIREYMAMYCEQHRRPRTPKHLPRKLAKEAKRQEKEKSQHIAQVHFAVLSQCIKALKYRDLAPLQKRLALASAVLQAHRILEVVEGKLREEEELIAARNGSTPRRVRVNRLSSSLRRFKGNPSAFFFTAGENKPRQSASKVYGDGSPLKHVETPYTKAFERDRIPRYSSTRFCKLIEAILTPLVKKQQQLQRFSKTSEKVGLLSPNKLQIPHGINFQRFEASSDPREPPFKPLSKQLYIHHQLLYFRDEIRRNRYLYKNCAWNDSPEDILEYEWDFVVEKQTSTSDMLEPSGGHQFPLNPAPFGHELGNEFLSDTLGKVFEEADTRRGFIISAASAQGKTVMLRKLVLSAARHAWRKHSSRPGLKAKNRSSDGARSNESIDTGVLPVGEILRGTTDTPFLGTLSDTSSDSSDDESTVESYEEGNLNFSFPGESQEDASGAADENGFVRENQSVYDKPLFEDTGRFEPGFKDQGTYDQLLFEHTGGLESGIEVRSGFNWSRSVSSPSIMYEENLKKNVDPILVPEHNSEIGSICEEKASDPDVAENSRTSNQRRISKSQKDLQENLLFAPLTAPHKQRSGNHSFFGNDDKDNLLGRLIPVFLPATALGRMAERHTSSRDRDRNSQSSKAESKNTKEQDLLLLYLGEKYGYRSARYSMLKTAYILSKLVICLDGLDEIGSSRTREVVQDYILHTLIRSNCRIIMTMRQESVGNSTSKFAQYFAHIRMCSLSLARQKQLVQQKMRLCPPGHVVAVKSLLVRDEYRRLVQSPVMIEVVIHAFYVTLTKLKLSSPSLFRLEGDRGGHLEGRLVAGHLSVALVYDHGKRFMLTVTDRYNIQASRLRRLESRGGGYLHVSGTGHVEPGIGHTRSWTLSGTVEEEEQSNVGWEGKLSDPDFEKQFLRKLAFRLHVNYEREFTVEQCLSVVPVSRKIVDSLNILLRTCYEGRVPLVRYHMEPVQGFRESASPNHRSGDLFGDQYEKLHQTSRCRFSFVHLIWQEHLAALYICDVLNEKYRNYLENVQSNGALAEQHGVENSQEITGSAVEDWSQYLRKVLEDLMRKRSKQEVDLEEVVTLPWWVNVFDQVEEMLGSPLKKWFGSLKHGCLR